MNDIATPPVLFEIPAPLSETITTRNFGEITMTAPAMTSIERVVGEAGAAHDEEGGLRELIAECAHGPHGERFTPDMLTMLPGQCFGDWIALRAAVIRVCGLNRDEVGNI